MTKQIVCSKHIIVTTYIMYTGARSGHGRRAACAQRPPETTLNIAVRYRTIVLMTALVI